MLKKLIVTAASTIFILVLLKSGNVKAANFTDNQTVDAKKTWTIHFNQNVLFDNLSRQSILVTDSKNNIADVTTTLGQDDKTIVVSAPSSGYTAGEKYTLTIGDKVHSKTNKKLQSNVVIHFNIKNKEPVSCILKNTDKPQISTGCGNVLNNELWLKYSDGTEELLISCKPDDDMKKVIAQITNPQLSPDKTKVYFMSVAWATSYSIHAVDVKTKSEHFVCDGNSLKVVTQGPYFGDLIVNQHRYYGPPNYGSYDDFYIVDEHGNEIKDLGEHTEALE